MKQTVEEAAVDFADYELKNLDKLPFVVSAKADYDNGLTKGFKSGAEWQSKQSPWISVNERLPEPNKEVLLYDNNSIRHYVIGWLRKDKGYNKGMWALSNGWIEDKDITHWMPIDKPITE